MNLIEQLHKHGIGDYHHPTVKVIQLNAAIAMGKLCAEIADSRCVNKQCGSTYCETRRGVVMEILYAIKDLEQTK